MLPTDWTSRLYPLLQASVCTSVAAVLQLCVHISCIILCCTQTYPAQTVIPSPTHSCVQAVAYFALACSPWPAHSSTTVQSVPTWLLADAAGADVVHSTLHSTDLHADIGVNK